MKHMGLFEGIGGFSLAAMWMRWETVAWVEKDTFCQQVLRHHLPKAEGHTDIKEFDGTKYRGAIDIITGGFPCQPFSNAGQQRGTADDRYLWPDMRRVIHEVAPRWVLAENVPGLINWSGGMVIDTVLSDLENEGYQTLPPLIIPACAKDAPHKRNRVWIVAYSDGNRGRKGQPEYPSKQPDQDGEATTNPSSQTRNSGQRPDIDGRKRKAEEHKPHDWQRIRDGFITNGTSSDATNSDQFDGNISGYAAGEISQFEPAGLQWDHATDTDSFIRSEGGGQ